MKNGGMNLIKLLNVFILIIVLQSTLSAATIKGVVTDKQSGEPLIGVAVEVDGTSKYELTGLDGSYKLKGLSPGSYTITAGNYIGYEDVSKSVELESEDDDIELNFVLSDETYELEGVNINVELDRESESVARLDEKNSDNVVNIVSSKTIEASPDITVANVAQRVSGVSLERSNTGDGQHAIVRGIDKRYNYTLVNGVKIPSPENDNRFVPLDIFPSDMLERLVVTKALTPDMEGDAIGGVVDMKLKNAPRDFTLKLNVGTGFNTMFFDRDYVDFNRSVVNMQSPRMANADPNYRATIDDFPLDNANHQAQSAMPFNQIYGLSLGQRFGEKKQLGVIVAASHQQTFRGSESDFFSLATDDETNLPSLRNVTTATRSVRQQRSGFHIKSDYKFNKNNKLELYAAYIRLAESETRTMVDTALRLSRSGPGTGRIEQWIRTRQRISNIYTSNLSGEHNLHDNFSLDWSTVVSSATYDDPDMAEFMTISERRTSSTTESGFRQTDWTYDNTNHRGFFRRWRGNSDTDLAGYLNLSYRPEIFGKKVLFKTGGMHRYKERENYFDRYRLGPTNPSNQQWDGDVNNNTFSVANPGGTLNHALNYELTEHVTGLYAMSKFMLTDKLQVLGGARIELTNMQWISNAPSNVSGRIGEIDYAEVLPSLHLKYMLNDKQNLRASYFESISRQGYLEIIPYSFYEEDQFRQAGNPFLQHAYARNVDLRYEMFPRSSEQFMVGTFLKQIENPIETGVVEIPEFGSGFFLQPRNFGTVTNYGIEFDFVKYYNAFGVRANYTYTQSEITTPKIERFRNEDGDLTSRNVDQTRPLQGQSAHLGNISALYKNNKSGTDAQLSFVYTGRRIAIVSPFKDNDQWQRAFLQLDFSIDQKITKGLVGYCKITNLLNTPYVLEIPASNEIAARQEPHLQEDSDRVLSRYDIFQRTVLIGLRYSLQ